MIIGICWYLSALLLLTSLLASAITVAPGHGSMLFEIAGSVGGAFIFAAAAIILHTRQWPWIRQSKLARSLFLAFAVLATLCLVPLVVG